MADCMGLALDSVGFEYELGACTKNVDLGWYQLPMGSLGGCYLKYIGFVAGYPRIEMHLEWQMTPHTDPHWDIQGCYSRQIDAALHLLQAHDLPQAGNRLLLSRSLRVGGNDRHGHARSQCHRVRRCRSARHHHQRGPPPPGLRWTLCTGIFR